MSITWRGDFETGSFSQWTYGVQQKVSGRASIVQSPLRQGSYAARFEVRSGDNNVAGSGSGERTEALIPADLTGAGEGVEQWWAWSTFFPADFQSPGGEWNVFTQFHHTGSTGQSNIHFDVRNGQTLGLRVMGGNASSPTRKDFTLAQLERGRWYDFVFHVRWSSSGAGFVEVWVNGSKVVPLTSTPTLYPGMLVYLKQGYYRVAFSGTTVIFHDGMRRGDSYADVAAEFPGTEPAPDGVPFTVTEHDTGTLMLRFTPVPGAAGYRLFRDGKAISSSWDPLKSSWRVAKPVDGLVLHAYGLLK